MPWYTGNNNQEGRVKKKWRKVSSTFKKLIKISSITNLKKGEPLAIINESIDSQGVQVQEVIY